MSEKFKKLFDQFNQLDTRMRLLTTFAVALIVVLVIDLLWLTPTNQKIKQLSNQIIQFQNQIEETTKNQADLNQAIIDQRNHPKKVRLDNLKTQVQELKVLLEEKTINLVAPSEMAKVLKDIINSSSKLKLMSLNKSKPLPLFKNEPNKELDEEEQIQIYQHSVELILSGSYKSAKNFIVALENMPQKIAFDTFQFTVDKYPNSEIKLEVSTLSFNKKWIGG